MQKVAYFLCNLLTLALGMWKCRSMGLLPTGTGDWLAFETRGQVSTSPFGQTFHPHSCSRIASLQRCSSFDSPFLCVFGGYIFNPLYNIKTSSLQNGTLLLVPARRRREQLQHVVIKHTYLPPRYRAPAPRRTLDEGLLHAIRHLPPALRLRVLPDPAHVRVVVRADVLEVRNKQLEGWVVVD